LTVEVPPNTTATVLLPESTLQGVSEGGKTLANRDDMKNAHQDGNAVSVDVGSGTYVFESILQAHPQ